MPKAIAILATALTLASAFPCRAGELPYGVDAYAGVMGGYGGQHRAPPAAGRSYAEDDEKLSGSFYGAYAGAGRGLGAVEAGWLKLPDVSAYAVGLDPPRTATGTLRGAALFARALLRAPEDWALRPYVFAGAARVKVESHEYGQCAQCGPDYRPDFRETLTAIRPYVGAGVEVGLFGPLSARAEFGYIPKAVQSEHVATRDYLLGSVAVQIRF
jgi:hypothetical protein